MLRSRCLHRSSKRPAWQRVPPRNTFYYRSPKHANRYVLSFVFMFDAVSNSDRHEK